MSRLSFLRAPAFWWILFAVWAGVLYWLSSFVPQMPAGPEVSDKVLHFFFFGLGGALLGGALSARRPKMRIWLVVAAVTVVIALIGVLDEWHQSFTPGRSGNDPGDMLADALGGLAAGLISPFFFGVLFRWIGRGESRVTSPR